MIQCGIFQFSLQAYAERHPSIAMQSFETLAEALLNFETNNPIAATSGTQGYAANVIGKDLAAGITTESITKLVAAAVREALSSQKKQKMYCWTHGFNITHKSIECHHPAEGHQTKATTENKMGGNSKEWKPRPKT